MHENQCRLRLIRSITVIERLQKRNDVADVLVGHCRLVAELTVERRIFVVDVRAELQRKVIVFSGLPIGALRIKLFWRSVSFVIERHHVI